MTAVIQPWRGYSTCGVRPCVVRAGNAAGGDVCAMSILSMAVAVSLQIFLFNVNDY